MPLSSIQSDGWRATYTSPPAAFDPVGSPETFSVTRAGFDASGSAASVVDTVTLMKRVRLPYPNEGTLTASDVALSDFVYQGDTIAGVTNNSARAYPKPIVMWLNPDMEIASGGTHTVRLAVAHMHARSGRPVAAVKFIASDGTNSVEVLVSTMSAITYAASGLTVPHFSAELDLSTLADDAEIEIDAIVYPWVGDAWQLSVDGRPRPTINASTLHVINAVTSYAPVYAYVDPVGGNDGTGIASETPATAAAAPFAGLAAATSALRAFNSANRGRDEAGGGIIRIADGATVIMESIRSAAGTVSAPLAIEGVSRSGSVLTNADAHTSNSAPNYLALRNLTVLRGYDKIVIDNGGTNGNVVILDQVTFDNGGAEFYGAWIYKVGRCYAVECDGDNPLLTFSTANKVSNTIGCGGTVRGVYHSAGSNVFGAFSDGNADNGREPLYGQFLGFNFIRSDSPSKQLLGKGYPVGPDGMAVVGNIFEDMDGGSASLAGVLADGNEENGENIVIQQNTMVGQRFNFLYNDTAYSLKSGSVRNNAIYEFNTKSDLFNHPTLGRDGSRVGNWAAIHHVGYGYNGYINGSSNESTPYAGAWLGELLALGETAPVNPDWTLDASSTGTGAGQGDYTPGAATELPTIPTGLTAYPVDLYGRPLATDGTAYAGAVQIESTGTTYSRVAACDAASALGAAARRILLRAASSAGASALMAAAHPHRFRSAGAAGATVMTAAARRHVPRSVAAAAEAGLATALRRTLRREASAGAASGAFAGRSTVQRRAAGADAGGGLSAVPRRHLRRAASMGTVSALRVSIAGAARRQVSFAGISGLGVTATRTLRRRAEASAAGSETAQAVITRRPSVSVSAFAIVTVAPVRALRRAADVGVVSTFSASTSGAAARQVSISAAGAMAAAGRRSLHRAGHVGTGTNVLAMPVRRYRRPVDIASAAVARASARRELRRDAAMSGEGALSVGILAVEPPVPPAHRIVTLSAECRIVKSRSGSYAA